MINSDKEMVPSKLGEKKMKTAMSNLEVSGLVVESFCHQDEERTKTFIRVDSRVDILYYVPGIMRVDVGETINIKSTGQCGDAYFIHSLEILREGKIVFSLVKVFSNRWPGLTESPRW